MSPGHNKATNSVVITIEIATDTAVFIYHKANTATLTVSLAVCLNPVSQKLSTTIKTAHFSLIAVSEFLAITDNAAHLMLLSITQSAGVGGGGRPSRCGEEEGW